MTRRVVIAPHADDETLGCGGLLAKYPDTHVVVVATPDEGRHAEFARAMDLFGVHSTEILNWQDGSVGHNAALLVHQFDEVLRARQPDELYLPFPDSHQDHIAVYEAGMRSARLSMRSTHWCPPTVLVYDVPAYDLQLFPTDLRWNVFEGLSPVQVQKKANAMVCYDSQVPNEEHPASVQGVVARARSLGAPRGLEFAEQYAAVRMVRR